MPRTKCEILLALVALLVIGIHLQYLLAVRTGVPHQDEWSGLYGMFHSLDTGGIGAWMVSHHNGHLSVPSKLAYYVAFNFWSLDLTPLRMLNFPICLGAFLLTARAINLRVRRRSDRYYLYLGAAFIIFNLCLWEHFSQASAFCVILAAVLGGVGLYFVCRGCEADSGRLSSMAYGITLVAASALSFGLGYLAIAAGIAVPVLQQVGAWTRSAQPPRLRVLGHALLAVFALIGLMSHPAFQFSGRAFRTIHHFLLVLGSIMPSALEASPVAQNLAFIIGLMIALISLWILVDFLTTRPRRAAPLSLFSLSLVLFGVLACAAVAVARPQLPDQEFLSSRYTLQPSIALLGILLYLAGGRFFLMAHVWCLAATGYSVATLKERAVAPHRPAVYQNIENAIRNADSLSDEQLQGVLYWRENTPYVRSVAARLKKDRLNFFRHDK